MIRIVISFILFNVSMMLSGMAHAADFEAATMTVPASGVLEPGLLKGEHYKITAPVTVEGQEKLKELGYTDELIRIFFSNKAYSPTRQTAIVAALASLDNVKGRQVLLDIANAAETPIESQFIVRSALVARLYHETVEPIAELMSLPNGMVPAAVTVSGDGLIFAPLDQLLWTEEIATALENVAKLLSDHGASDEQIMWIEGRISKIAMTQLVASGWVESTQRFDVDGDPDSAN